ncbi:hypothetical protein [Streptomyces sp. RFCAC02]|uniref:hypothetical protein n=1 Tax=Streptomyces sp. RFCAC02 TaxID=2499143 RepID=UPI00102062FA|nr:hypothetical protein [Streptomyces sp. RFCAC02]
MYEIHAAEASVPLWIAAIASVISALGGVAGCAALVILLRRRQAVARVPPAEVSRLLHELEGMFDELLANGGLPVDWFLAPEQRRTGQLLASYTGLIGDDELRTLVAHARESVDNCWAAAPAVLPGAAAAGLPADELAAIDERLERQLTEARTGRAMTARAIARLDHLLPHCNAARAA